MEEFVYTGYGKMSEGPLPGFVDISPEIPRCKYDLAEHPFFTEWKDPESGIVSYILTERAAPVHVSFYFVNSSISDDGEYLWFYVAFPPNSSLFLARVALDPAKEDIKWFPQSNFTDRSPMVNPDSSGVFFFSDTKLVSMDNDGNTKIIGEIPADYIANRTIFDISSHLTISADGRYFLVDGVIGNDTFLALMEVKTGEFKLLHEFPYKHNHSQFSPVNPKQFLCPRDWRRHPFTGKYEFMESRLWLMDIDQTCYKPLCPDFWESNNGNTAHEWWSKDGLVCFVDYAKGVMECNPDTREICHVWKRPLCHAHSTAGRRYFCGDQSPYLWQSQPVQILFYDREKDREYNIVSAMPQPPMPRNPYHLDPHPQFSPDGSQIVYMTTVLGKVDVAVTPVRQFLD